MRLFILTSFLLALGGGVIGQIPEWQWINSGGGVSSWTPSQPTSPDDEITNVDIDSSGNVVVTGNIFTSASAKINSTTLKGMRGYKDGVVAKFNCDGELLWYKIIGGVRVDEIYDLEIGSNGDVFLCGTVAPGINPTDSVYVGDHAFKFLGGRQSFLLKLDSNGVLKWIHIGYSSNTNNAISTGSIGYSLGIANDKSIYLYGISISEGAEFYPGIELNETHFIAKYDDSGHVLWAEKIMPFPNQVLIQEMEVADNGNCLLVGTLRDTIVIDGDQFNPMNVNGESIVLEYDSSGDYQWGHISQSPIGCNGHRIAIDVKNTNQYDFYIVGNAVSGTKFGSLTLPPTSAAGIGYVVKYENYVPAWQHHIFSNASTGLVAVDVFPNKDVIVGTTIKGNLSIGGMKVLGNQGDPFVAKFSSSGDTLFSKVASASTEGDIVDIKTGFNGNFYVGGSFEQQIGIPGDSLWNVGGNTDMFIAKFGIKECEDTTTIDTTTNFLDKASISSLNWKIYPNPNSGQFYIDLNQTGEFNYNVYNVIGELVHSGLIKNKKIEQINLPNELKNGVYFMQLNSTEGTASKRVILQND